MLHVAVMAGVAYLRDVSKLLSIYMNGIYSCLDVSEEQIESLSRSIVYLPIGFCKVSNVKHQSERQ